MRVAETIQRARQQARMTQQELAEAVGVSLRTITSWERGSTLPLNRIPVLEQILGVTLTEPPSVAGTLQGVSDRELLEEVARRMAAARSAVPSPVTPLPGVIDERQRGESWAARRRNPPKTDNHG